MRVLSIAVVTALWLGVLGVTVFHAPALQAQTPEASSPQGASVLGTRPGTGAQPGPSARTDKVEVTLVPEWTTVPASGGTLWFALRQTIIPGWHTYYKNPGDSGEPTMLQWALPEGFSAGAIEWPLPHRLPYGPLVNFGFEDEAVFLVPVQVPAGLTPGQDVAFDVEAYWLVCEDICIPEEAPLRVRLPVRGGAPEADEAHSALFAQARSALPQTLDVPARYTVTDGQFRIGVEAPDLASGFGSGLVEKVVFFPDKSGIIDNPSAQDVFHGPNGFVLTTKPGHDLADPSAAVPSVSGLFVLTDVSSGAPIRRGLRVTAGTGALPAGLDAVPLGTARGGTAPGGPALGGSGGGLSLGGAILFAVLGGLILNLMPCVFPILFMKALGFVSAAQKAPMEVRLHGLAFTAGVMLSFLALAGAFLALRAGGAQIGWGFQLQDPAVVAALMLVILAVGLNLSGVFEIGQSVMGLGGSAGTGSGFGGAFLTGVLATVVATPCTAPFMGAAIGLALAQPPVVALTIFAALGFGMALPWLALSMAPSLLRLLPKPGAWMVTFRQILAFPMYGAAAWLLWVLTRQVGSPGLAMVLAASVLLAFAAWAFGRTQDPEKASDGRGWLVGRALALVALMGCAVLAYGGARDAVTAAPAGGAPRTQQAAGKLPVVPFDPDRLAALRAEGKPVFLNFTAAWCITCLVNERVALSQPSVIDRFAETGVVYMKGDWTNRDARITAMLDRFGRNGVPLYVYFPPHQDGGAPDPMILPQLLRESTVLDVLEGLEAAG